MPNNLTGEPSLGECFISYQKLVGATLTVFPDAVNASWRKPRRARIVDLDIGPLGATYFVEVDKIAAALQTISVRALIAAVKAGSITIDSVKSDAR